MRSNQAQSPFFAQLPREVRDIIYEMVIGNADIDPGWVGHHGPRDSLNTLIPAKSTPPYKLVPFKGKHILESVSSITAHEFRARYARILKNTTSMPAPLQLVGRFKKLTTLHITMDQALSQLMVSVPHLPRNYNFAPPISWKTTAKMTLPLTSKIRTLVIDWHVDLRHTFSDEEVSRITALFMRLSYFRRDFDVTIKYLLYVPQRESFCYKQEWLDHSAPPVTLDLVPQPMLDAAMRQLQRIKTDASEAYLRRTMPPFLTFKPSDPDAVRVVQDVLTRAHRHWNWAPLGFVEDDGAFEEFENAQHLKLFFPRPYATIIPVVS